MSAFRVIAALLLSTGASLAQVVIPAVPPLPQAYYAYADPDLPPPPPPAPSCCKGKKCAAPCAPVDARN